MLINPKYDENQVSVVLKFVKSGTTPVLRTTKHYFLDLPLLSPELQAYIDRTSTLGGWSSNSVQARDTPGPILHSTMRQELHPSLYNDSGLRS